MTALALTDVALVACSRVKLDRAAPACDLYFSPLFRAARAHAERQYGPGRWLILSAHWGLVDPERVLGPYDVTLADFAPVQRHAWATRVAEDLSARFDRSTTFWFHAGALYREPLMQLVANPTRAPLAGLRIGQQIAWYRQRLDDERARPGPPRRIPRSRVGGVATDRRR